MLEAAFRTKNLHKTTPDLAGQAGEAQAEPDGAALFLRFCRLLQRHQNLTELGFVPYADPGAYGGGSGDGDAEGADEEDGESGRPFFAWEGSLGMAFWALPPLYKHAWTALIPLLRVPRPQQQQDWDQQVNDLSRVVLLINADNYTAWNVRKRLITEAHSSIEQEYQLVNLVMSKHPKSGETWAHRRWLLHHLASHADALLSQDVVQGDLDTCLYVAQRYPKNYHAWTHRLLLTHTMGLEQVTKELRHLETWGRRYVGDHSGWHHRQALLLRALHVSGFVDAASQVYRPDPQLYAKPASPAPPSSREQVLDLWRREFWLCRKLILVYPGHEALWFHRRFIMDHWVKHLLPQSPAALTAAFYDHQPTRSQDKSSSEEEEQDAGVEEEEEEIGFKPDERGEDEGVVLAREARFIERCCTDDTQERFEAQREAGRAYLAWLSRFVLQPREGDRHLVALDTGAAAAFDPALGPRRHHLVLSRPQKS